MFSSCSKKRQGPLSRCEDTLKKILVLAETVKQNTSSPGQKFIKDEIETLQSEHRSLEERLEDVKQKEENIFSEALELKDEFGNEIQMEDKGDALLKREVEITSDTPVAAEESSTAVEVKEEMHHLSIFVDSNDSRRLFKEACAQTPFVYSNLNFIEIDPSVNIYV